MESKKTEIRKTEIKQTKNRKSRISVAILTVLTIALTAGVSLLLPTTSRAAQEEGTISFVVVNPLYEDVITKGELLATIKQNPKSNEEALVGDGTVYTSAEAAGIAIRSAMKSRQATVTLQIKTTTYPSQTLSDQIMASALKHTGVETEGDYIAWQYGGYSGSNSFSYSGGYYNVTSTYNFSYYTTAAQEAVMDDKIPETMQSLGFTSTTTRYEKIYAIYKYICDNVVYDYPNLNNSAYKLQYTAYAALVNKTAVCQGYAVLLYRMLLNAQIDTRVIVGYAGGPHAWNIIKIANLYYNADSTWDAAGYGWYYFLVAPSSFTDHVRDTEYDTAEFHAAYPMATTNYVAGSGVGDNDPADTPTSDPTTPADPTNPSDPTDPTDPTDSTDPSDLGNQDGEEDEDDEDDEDEDDEDDEDTIDLADCEVTLSYQSTTYTGKYLQPKVTVKYDGEEVPSDCYEVEYENNKAIGTATVWVWGDEEELTGYKDIDFTINPKKTTLTTVKSPKTKKMTVKWKKQTYKNLGYELQLSTTKKFTKGKNTKTITVKKYTTTSNTVASLKKKTNYYVRIRTFVKSGSKTYYSGWSTIKKAKTK